MANENPIFISQLKYGIRFTLQNLDGVFVRVKKLSVGNLTYIKEGVEDLYYCANMPIKKIIV